MADGYFVGRDITETHEVKEDDVARLRRLLKSFGGTE